MGIYGQIRPSPTSRGKEEVLIIKKIKMPFILTCAILLLVACTSQPTNHASGDGIPELVLLHPIPSDMPELIFNHNIGLDECTLPFAEIIAFYGNLEQNGFIDYTRGYERGVGQLHPIAWRYNVGRIPAYWRVLFAFYDITGNGQPDLIIGATGSRHFFPYVVGIYTLLDGVPASVIQYDGSRTNLFLLTNIYGNVIIESAWGHGGSSYQLFYYIGENGELLLLDRISSYDFNIDHHILTGELIRPRIRHVDGIDVNLTEMEYIALMHKYGSMGYEMFRSVTDVFPIGIVTEDEFTDWLRTHYPCKYANYKGFGHSRRVTLEWEYILLLTGFPG